MSTENKFEKLENELLEVYAILKDHEAMHFFLYLKLDTMKLRLDKLKKNDRSTRNKTG